MPAGSLAEWLRSLPDDDLHSLLRARPDLATPAPANSAVLAQRAGTKSSLSRACDGFDAFTLTVLDALLVAGADTGDVRADDVAALLGPDVPARRLSAALDELRRHALVWGRPEALRLVPAAREVAAPFPGGLGRENPALAGVDVDALLRRVDEQERTVLGALAGGSPLGRTTRAEDGGSDGPVRRLLDRGLLLRRDPETVELPRQVALGLRGSRPMGDVPVTEPTPSEITRGAAEVDSAAAGEAAETLRHCEFLLRDAAATPPAVLRSGGIGVRELRRYARELDITSSRVALLLELLTAARLLATDEQETPRWTPTTRMDGWLSQAPAMRWAALAQTWLELPRLPWMAGERDPGGRTMGVLTESLGSVLAPAARRRVLAALAGLPRGVAPASLDELVALLRWRAPRCSGSLHEATVRNTVAEATTLGVVALDAISGPGRALLETDGDEAAAAAMHEAMPEPISYVLCQPDLTVVAPGPLQADLAAEMRLLADVESAGLATVYRVGESSVRRALDAGRGAAEVHALFAERSQTPVPQALTYLIDDTARKHGRLRGGTAGSFLRCDDPALVGEVLAHPGTASLGLRRIAEGVLVSPLPLIEVLEGLRNAGFAPAAEDEAGQTVDLRPAGARTPVRAVRRRAPQPLSPPGEQVLRSTVEALRSGDRTSDVRRGANASPGTGRRSTDTVAVLSHAVLERREVWVGVVDSHGVASERVIQPTHVGSGVLAGRDVEDAQEWRYPLHLITSVALVER